MSRGYPDRKTAEKLLLEAERSNPGPWGGHSRVAARCAERIAQAAGQDPEKAYVLGLLHDIGRKFGISHLGHVWDGWQYMTELGYSDAARVCLTHSFVQPDIRLYVGNYDIPEEQQQALQEALSALEYDDYDRLIQLCDCLAGSDGVMDMEARMEDVERRYGFYPREKWEGNLALKAYFEAGCGADIYAVVGRTAG